MSLVVVWVELNDSFKQFYGFRMIFSWSPRLNLGQNSESLETVFELRVWKNFLKVLLGALEVS
jgi:hypothetical protein